jgi:hypothetical protein
MQHMAHSKGLSVALPSWCLHHRVNAGSNTAAAQGMMSSNRVTTAGATFFPTSRSMRTSLAQHPLAAVAAAAALCLVRDVSALGRWRLALALQLALAGLQVPAQKVVHEKDK